MALRRAFLLFFTLLFFLLGAGKEQDVIKLRAWQVPTKVTVNPIDQANRSVIDQFRRHYPWIEPVAPVNLLIQGGNRTQDMVPLLQIAGGVAADVLYVPFKGSETYIDMNLLYPLDHQVEQWAHVKLPDGQAMDNANFIAALDTSDNRELIHDRIPQQVWPVMRRLCPRGKGCPWRAAEKLTPLAKHYHIYLFPQGPMVRGLMYNRAAFAEHASEGIEMRAPRDWEEFLKYAKILTDPPKHEFGFELTLDLPAWDFMPFLDSAGGQAVQQDANGNWRCTLDTDAAVEAAWFFARLRNEKIVRDGETYRGVIGYETKTPTNTYAMTFEYLDENFLAAGSLQTYSVAPVPAGPTGLRSSEFNCRLYGIFSGLKDNDRRRDAAWKYIEYYNSPEANQIRTEKLIERGLGAFVREKELKKFNVDGRYNELLRQHSQELEETYRIAYQGGVPEPYGKNCQFIYDEINKPLGAIWNDPIVIDAIDKNRPEIGKAEIRQILQRATTRINEKLIGNISPQVAEHRSNVAWFVIAIVTAIFAIVFWRVWHAFRGTGHQPAGLKFGALSRITCYGMMLPALASIALWAYWPMIRGTAIAFQDYSVLGDSRWIGSANFASVLYNEEFWYSLKISLVYAIMFFLFGFWVPIGLALLLHEVPTGKTLFRTLYYLPAVLSGVVVIFLWKSFYSPDGLINQFINFWIAILNLFPGIHLGEFHSAWLTKPTFALFFTLLPTVWAGMGPGCLIYLAALKTIPDDLYEAADIDGAGVRRKIFNIALPSIRALIGINFIGAMIGAVRGAGGFVLAMTGGAPFGENGGATEVIGLKIFFTTFGYLQFGVGAAMAWILGSMLIGFTVLQIQRLSKLEFRTAEKVA